MRKILTKLTLKQKLALIALLLGFIALFAGNPYRSNKVKVDLKDLALSTVKETYIIDPEILADWIIQGKADFILIDLRSEGEYEKYFLPSAENIPLVNLPDADFPHDQKIILYSKNNIQAAQGWFILRSKGFKNVYILDEGIEGWKSKVLFPVLKANPTKDELEQFEKKKAIAHFFGGKALNETGVTDNKFQIELPTQSSIQKKTVTTKLGSSQKKKREGC